MKASVKIRDEQHHQNPLLRAKIPISVFGLPFTSAVNAGDPSDLSFSLRTSSTSGPSLRLFYNPNTTTTNPFSLTLKSGVGLFGSPINSPLIMSAHFNLIGNPNPTFSLQIKPQFGDFSLKKTTLSASSSTSVNTNDHSKENAGTHINGLVWRDLSEFHGRPGGILSGVAVMAKTVLPVTKRAVVRFRWGVNFPSDFGGKKWPFLTFDKVGIERVEQEQEVKSKSSVSNDLGDMEMLKGMCLWMGKEVEVLQKENREMRDIFEEIRRSGISLRNYHRESDHLGKKNHLTSPVGSSNEFERWRNKRNGNGEENGRREMKKSSGSENPVANDVGEELKRAIKAASS
ncbi:uncharacterized protein LOC122069868 [Macadamia integrifolia]|uniref:uncharacterized protein LOC122069868 n=1 Tax=Macadamia integrifolia TaxID=60698 RepID=UPI001C4F35BA|nr:uncharacterized protein LOC122069868 [Macadamia integrifolia]